MYCARKVHSHKSEIGFQNCQRSKLGPNQMTQDQSHQFKLKELEDRGNINELCKEEGTIFEKS
jgi:hypothetical protein